MSTLNEQDLLSNDYEPLRVYRWIFVFDSIPSYMAKTFARPARAFEETAIDWINTKRWLAGKHTWNDIQMTLYSPIAPSAAGAVQEWCALNFDEVTGKAGYASTYKKTISIQMIDPVGNIAEEWTLGGCWPREVNYNELDYASSEAATITLTIRYDSALLAKVASKSEDGGR